MKCAGLYMLFVWFWTSHFIVAAGEIAIGENNERLLLKSNEAFAQLCFDYCGSHVHINLFLHKREQARGNHMLFQSIKVTTRNSSFWIAYHCYYSRYSFYCYRFVNMKFDLTSRRHNHLFWHTSYSRNFKGVCHVWLFPQ